MATTPNQKPVPSEDYANMRFNAGKFDEFMTSTASSYVDRLGITHLTVKGIQASVTGALLPANNLSDVQSAATSRTNLGATTIGSQVFTATTAANARTAILAAVRGANSDITGLSGIITSPTLTDANAATSTGWYLLAGSASNLPQTAFSVIYHMQASATIASQILFTTTAGVQWTRTMGASTWNAWTISAKGGANADITSLTGLTTPLSAAQGGTGNTTGLAATATALATSRTFQTNLAITTAVGFTGAANNVHGVTGTLPISNGGTGATTAAAALTSLGAKANAGVTDASSAAAGVVGEVLTATTLATSQTSTVQGNATSLVLTPGDWEVCGVVSFNSTTAPYTAINCGINTVSATGTVFPYRTLLSLPFASGATQQIEAPRRRFNVTANTTVYLVASSIFASGTSTVDGYLEARRVR